MRTRLRTIGVATVAAVAFAATGASASETTDYQGDAGHSGGVVDPALDGPLQVRWTQRLGKGLSYPLLVGGRVFVVAPPPVDGPQRQVVALDAASGTELWRRSLTKATDLTFADGTLYALGQDGVVTAMDPATGATRWANGAPALEISGVSGPPVHVGGRIVYFGATGSEGTAVVALDARDGTLRWHVPFTSYVWNAGLAADARGVYLGVQCGYAYSLAPDGAVRWTTRTACPGEPSSFGDRAVVADGRVLTDPRSGAVLDAAGGAVVDQFVRAGGLPAFGTGHVATFGERRLTLADRATLTPTVTLAFENPDNYVLGQPFFVGDRVFMQSNLHHLIGIDAATATVTADVDLDVQLPARDSEPPADGSGGIAVGGGVMAVATTDGRVVAVTGPGGPTPPGTDPTTGTDPATGTDPTTGTDPATQGGPAPLPTRGAAIRPAAARRVSFPGGAKLSTLRRRGLVVAVTGARAGATVDAVLRAGKRVLWRDRARVPASGRVRLAAVRRAIHARSAQLELRVSAKHAAPLVLRRTLR